ncbi:MAG: site-specific integrase [Candidatus Methanoperedens sp.]|nr:site-specific integrase [Candidatus Methanoperedens sp.]
MGKTQKPDIHRVDREYEQALESFRNNACLSEKNTQLCLEFINDLKIGWGSAKKIGDHRLLKYLRTLRILTIMFESLDNELSWSYVQKQHIKTLLLMFDHKDGWNEWAIHGARTILKRFVTWMRKEHRYPQDYPEGERLNALILLVKSPVEVDYSTPRPKKLKSIDEIPTEEEVNWLIQAWDYYREETSRAEVAARNKAIITILAEIGIRIGGLGSLQIRDVIFDNIGAKISVTDKTMQGEPVRLITSAPCLKEWLNLHPWKNNPEAPLWVVLLDHNHLGSPMCYEMFGKMLKQSRRLHNKHAKENDLPLITRRLHFHAFRYYAQTRDMLEGMPVSIQCAQRGWKPNSDRPQQYARVTTAQVDEWLVAHNRLLNTAEAESIGRQS